MFKCTGCICWVCVFILPFVYIYITLTCSSVGGFCPSDVLLLAGVVNLANLESSGNRLFEGILRLFWQSCPIEFICPRLAYYGRVLLVSRALLCKFDRLCVFVCHYVFLRKYILEM